jgi:hypothetical protein
MENVFWGRLLELGVPNEAHAIRIIGRVFIVVVAGHQELWVLRRPIQGRQTTIT